MGNRHVYVSNAIALSLCAKPYWIGGWRDALFAIHWSPSSHTLLTRGLQVFPNRFPIHAAQHNYKQSVEQVLYIALMLCMYRLNGALFLLLVRAAKVKLQQQNKKRIARKYVFDVPFVVVCVYLCVCYERDKPSALNKHYLVVIIDFMDF